MPWLLTIVLEASVGALRGCGAEGNLIAVAQDLAFAPPYLLPIDLEAYTHEG